jgi:hypothetical protein
MVDDLPDLPGLPPFDRGDRVAGYVIEQCIAVGLSDVYRAREATDQHRLVALKIVQPSALRSSTPPAVTNGIPHVVETFAIGICNEWRVGYIAMKLVTGPSLAECIERIVALERRPTAAERRGFVRLLLQVARGLAELHHRVAIHRDVKPHNILIEGADDPCDAHGNAVLVDLGLVQGPGAPGANSTLMLAPAYAAPEQLLGQCIDARTDLFALGVTMHDVLLGRPSDRRTVRPTQGLERLDLIDPTIDRDLAAIVAECTALPPEHRYRDADRLVVDLERWLRGRQPSVRPRAPWTRYGRLLVRRPRIALVWGMLVATLILGVSLAGVGLAGSLEQQHHRTRYHEAIERGDLDKATRISLTVLAEETLDVNGEPGLEDVLALLRGNDSAGARRHAARLCSRDGLAEHPRLDRWFASLLRSSDPAVRLDAMQLFARAMYDHPRRPADPMPAAREAVLDLAATDTGQAGLFAITAAGALADVLVGDVLLAAARAQTQRHDTPREYARLLVEALHRLAFDTAVGRSNEEHVLRVEAQLHEWVTLMRTFDDFSAWAHEVRPSVEDWFLTIRRLRDAAGMSPPDPRALLSCWRDNVVFRCVGRVPEQLDDLAHARWPETMPLPNFAFDLGVAVGYSQPTADVLERIRTALRSDPLPGSPTMLAEFDEGRQFGAARLAHVASPWQVDIGSRLADELDTGENHDTLPTVAVAVDPGTVADFDLTTQPVKCGGAGGAVTGTWIRHQVDEHRPPQAFGWLGSPGRSAIEFEFVDSSDGPRKMLVRVEEQKGMRGAFPFGGEAGLDMSVDGVLQASWRDLGETEARVIPLALPRIEIGRRRRLTLRLRADANTTLRLYRVLIQ